jgi:small GTP-binding protein
MLVYDVTSLETFQALPTWFESINRYANPGTPIVLCGNKCDLPSSVSIEDAEDFAKSKDTELFLTSASSGERIEDAFMAVARLAISKKSPEGGAPAPAGPVPVDDKKKKKKKACVV